MAQPDTEFIGGSVTSELVWPSGQHPTRRLWVAPFCPALRGLFL